MVLVTCQKKALLCYQETADRTRDRRTHHPLRHVKSRGALITVPLLLHSAGLGKVSPEAVWKGQGYLRAQRILRPSDSEGWGLREAVISFHRSFLFKSRSGASCLANLSPANLKASWPPLKIRADAKLCPAVPAGHSSPLLCGASCSNRLAFFPEYKALVNFLPPLRHVTGSADTKINKDEVKEALPFLESC